METANKKDLYKERAEDVSNATSSDWQLKKEEQPRKGAPQHKENRVVEIGGRDGLGSRHAENWE